MVSTAINEALQLDAQGASQKHEMAIEGYQQALHVDPSHWIGQDFLGLTYLDLKQYDAAKAQLTRADADQDHHAGAGHPGSRPRRWKGSRLIFSQAPT